MGAFALVTMMALVVKMTYPNEMASAPGRCGCRREAQWHARRPAEDLSSGWRERLRSGEAWHRIGVVYRGEWGMVWKDLAIGFAVAGVAATLVPDRVFDAIFPEGLPAAILVPIHALLGPLLAVATIIGSMGNRPLAAVLWENGVMLAGIVVFLYADFVVLPSLRINTRYYGWRFAGYLAMVFTASAVGGHPRRCTLLGGGADP